MKYKQNLRFGFAVLLLIGLTTVARQFYFFKEQDENEESLPDAATEYPKIIDKLLDYKQNLNVSGNIRLYDGQSPQQLKEEQKFSYYRENNYIFYSSLGYQQTLSDGTLIISIDSVNRSIMVGKVDSVAVAASQKGMMNGVPIGGLPGDTSSIGFSGIVLQKGQERTIEFTNNSMPQIHSCKVTYDKNSYQLKSSEVTWWKNGSAILDSSHLDRVWITQTEYQYDKLTVPNIQQQIASVIRYRHSRIEAMPAYKNYTIRIIN